MRARIHTLTNTQYIYTILKYSHNSNAKCLTCNASLHKMKTVFTITYMAFPVLIESTTSTLALTPTTALAIHFRQVICKPYTPGELASCLYILVLFLQLLILMLVLLLLNY